MILEENHIGIIGLAMIIVGLGLIMIPLFRIEKNRAHQISLATIYQIENYIIRGKVGILTGLLWIICGVIINIAVLI